MLFFILFLVFIAVLGSISYSKHTFLKSFGLMSASALTNIPVDVFPFSKFGITDPNGNQLDINYDAFQENRGRYFGSHNKNRLIQLLLCDKPY